MSDIVDYMRAVDEERCNVEPWTVAKRCADAADEIERLRAALREIDEIGRVAAQVPGPRNKLMEICARARAAMGGGDD